MSGTPLQSAEKPAQKSQPGPEQQPKHTHPAVQHSKYFPLPDQYLGILNRSANAANPMGGNMKQLLHDHAARVICEHLEAGHHPGDLFADAGRALAAYDPATLNYHWLIIAHTAVCHHLFKSLPILVPELGRTLQPYPAGSHPSGQPPSRLPYTRTHFDAPAPEGYFKYRIDFPVPVGYSGRLLYSGATNFRAGIALNPECHYSLRREEWSDRAGDFMPDLPDLGPD